MDEAFIDQVEHLGAAIETGQIADIGEPALSLIEFAEALGFKLTVTQAFALLRTWRTARAGFAAAEQVVAAAEQVVATRAQRPSPVPRKKGNE